MDRQDEQGWHVRKYSLSVRVRPGIRRRLYDRELDSLISRSMKTNTQ